MTDYGKLESWTKLFRVRGPYSYSEVHYISDDYRLLLKEEVPVEGSDCL